MQACWVAWGLGFAFEATERYRAHEGKSGGGFIGAVAWIDDALAGVEGSGCRDHSANGRPGHGRIRVVNKEEGNGSRDHGKCSQAGRAGIVIG